MNKFSLSAKVPVLLNDKVAFITGAAKGCGAATAIRMAASGASVVVNYLSSEREAVELCKGIEAFGGKALAVRADMANESEAREAYRGAVARFGKVDILVHNATPAFRSGALADVEWTEYATYIDVLLKGAFNISKAVLPEMAARGYGRVISIGTTSTRTLNDSHSAYISAKEALWGLTKSIAVDYGADGITANMVSPGLVWTDLEQSQPADFGPEHRRRTPMGRNAEAKDIADAVLFFASDLASFVSGTDLPVCGGFLLTR